VPLGIDTTHCPDCSLNQHAHYSNADKDRFIFCDEADIKNCTHQQEKSIPESTAWFDDVRASVSIKERLELVYPLKTPPVRVLLQGLDEEQGHGETK